MLDALKFVERATADKDIIRILTHICVHDGMLQGADSKMALECACPELEGYSFTAPAEKFIKAISACEGIPSIEMQDDGRIKISHKRFRVMLPTLKADTFPRAVLKTETATPVACPSNFVTALKRIFPFISQDASRPWSLGVWLDGNYAYATNNVILVRTPLKWLGRPVNIPRYAVQEIIEISRSIVQLWQDKTAFGVEYNDAWFRAQEYMDIWPETAIKLFDKNQSNMIDVPSDLKSSIEKLIPFCPDVKLPTIYFKEGLITTANGEQSAELGFDWSVNGIYRAEVLQLVLGVARQWDPMAYPGPVFFKGDDIEGMMVGVRQ